MSVIGDVQLFLDKLEDAVLNDAATISKTLTSPQTFWIDPQTREIVREVERRESSLPSTSTAMGRLGDRVWPLDTHAAADALYLQRSSATSVERSGRTQGGRSILWMRGDVAWSGGGLSSTGIAIQVGRCI